MSEIVVLARLRVMATDEQLQEYQKKMQELEPNRKGLLGYSTWRSMESDGGLLQIWRYPNEAAANDALKALVDSKFGPLVASITMDPPDVIVFSPKHDKGKNFKDVPVGSLLSFVVRVADPGQQEELERDAEEVLNELSYIDGYLGSFWGNNITLSEEIVSIVTWSNAEALQKSVPRSHKVKLQRWQKAF